MGTAAFVIDLGTLLALAPYFPVVVANTIAFLVANAANFLIGHIWVFGQSLSSVTPNTYSRVLLVSIFGLLLNDAVVWILAVVFALPLVLSKVIATMAGLIWNYLARVWWVYPSQTSA